MGFSLWLYFVLFKMADLEGHSYTILFSFKILNANKTIPVTIITVNLIEKDFSIVTLSSHFINFSLKHKRYAPKTTIKPIKKT